METQTKHDYIVEERTHLKKWRDSLDQLNEDLTKIPADKRTRYRERIEVLRNDCDRVETRLQALEESDEANWGDRRESIEEAQREFLHKYNTTVEAVKNSDDISLGWLQGFTDHRVVDSEGWAEGYEGYPKDSNGWAEGFEGRPEDSKGWSEGYDKAN